jgi:hypothetical protein
MTDFNTISISELTRICGGGGRRGGGRGGGDYTNNYADPGHSERPDLDHFLYGGNMPDADREALIRNWEKSNGRKAPPPMRNQLNLNGQWPQVVA